MPQSASEPIRIGAISVRFVVEPEASGGSVSVFECRVPNGARVPVPHSHDAFEETAYGLQGTTEFTVDGTVSELGPGEAICIPRGAVHSFAANFGDAAFLAISTPGVFGPDYFREIAGVIAGAGDGPPDTEALTAVMRRHGLTPAPPAPA